MTVFTVHIHHDCLYSVLVIVVFEVVFYFVSNNKFIVVLFICHFDAPLGLGLGLKFYSCCKSSMFSISDSKVEVDCN